MSTIDKRFMSLALEEAQAAADEGEVPVGAVVACAGEVVARAHNRREAEHDPSAHAEFRALTQAAQALGRWRLSDCTVYVTLEPCPMCAGLMVNARVGRCVYGAADPKGGALGSTYALHRDGRLNHAFEVRAGIRADECSAVLSGFFSEARKRPGSASLDASLADEPAETARRREVPQPGWADAGSAADGMRDVQPSSLNVLLAVDSFKGSATSAQAEEWLARGVLHACPGARMKMIPIADGGEGTAEAVHAARGGTWRTAWVQGPLEGAHDAKFLLVDGTSLAGGAAPAGGTGPVDDAHPADGADPTGAAHPADGADPAGDTALAGGVGPAASATAAGSATAVDGVVLAGRAVQAEGASPAGDARSIAVIEMAEAAGIEFSGRTLDEALAASTCGVGELMLAAVEAGARTIYIGLGGSATSDGGAGMLQALGARILDVQGSPVASGLAGLGQVAAIDLEPAVRALAGVELVVLTDVDNPLVGARGAVRVFGPQKGLCRDLDTYDRWMIDYAQKLTAARDALDGSPWQVGEPGTRPRALAGVPGGGAAGGLGAALVALGARLTSGIQTVLDLVGFDEAACVADLVITGEGNMDEQTASGKAPVGVARRAKAAHTGVPVVAVCGGRADNLDAVYAAGIDLVLPAPRRPMALEQALSLDETRENLVAAGETAARAYLLGR